MAGTLPMSFTEFGSFFSMRVRVPSTASMTGVSVTYRARDASALLVKAANGSADLIVGVTGDVFHQEVDQAGITLQDREHL